MDIDIKKKFNEGIKKYAEFLEKDMGIIINGFSYNLDFETDTIEFSFPNDKVFKAWLICPSDLNKLNDPSSIETVYYGDWLHDTYKELKDEYIYGDDQLSHIYIELKNSLKTGIGPLLTTNDYKLIMNLIEENKNKSES